MLDKMWRKGNPPTLLVGVLIGTTFMEKDIEVPENLGHLRQRADSFEKTLMLGKIQGRRRRGQERMRWLDGISDSVDKRLIKL